MMPKIACVRDSDRCARNLTNSPDSSDVAALTTASVSEPEVRLLDVRALLERLARAVQDDAPVLEDVGAVRERERARDVLLDEQDGRAALVDPLQILEDQPDHHGSEAEAWLVQQQQPRARHEPAADGAHLLLAARERAGHLPLALAQAREEREDGLERGGAGRPLARAQLEVLAHPPGPEDLAPLRHVGDAARDHLRRRPAVDPLALELDAAAAKRQQPGDRAQRRRLAGAVAADEGDHFARVHLQRDLAHGHEVAVPGLDAIEAEQRGHIPRPGTPRRPGGGWR